MHHCAPHPSTRRLKLTLLLALGFCLLVPSGRNPLPAHSFVSAANAASVAAAPSGQGADQTPQASLLAPAGLTIRPDDRSAILEWELDPKRSVSELPAGVAGYRVIWGPASDPAANVRLSQHRILQLQPIDNGKPYIARVQAVDSAGRLSAPSEPVSFTGDPARVEALRTRMTGFFDSFNLAEGSPDELNWNTAYSLCNAAWANTYFINKQSHVHNTISSGSCDRAQQVNRARVPLDFSDSGTRTIVFDFDGVFRRNTWYLDLVPRLLDISGPERYEPGTIRIAQGDQKLRIAMIGPDGLEATVAETNWNPSPPLDAVGLTLVPNLRRHWEIRLRNGYAAIALDGKQVLVAESEQIQVQPQQYHLLWSTFSYNTAKANQPFVLAHWDNFGFDAPAGRAPAPVTLNYKLKNSGSDYIKAHRWDKSAPATVQLNIPDQLAGSLRQRLMFTLQMAGSDWYRWSPTDSVSINGQAFLIPEPISSTTAPNDDLVGVLSPRTVVIPLPDGLLRQGANTLVFDAEASGIHNLHVEVDFAPGEAPSYTAPSNVASDEPLLPMPVVGPEVVITHVGTTEVERYNSTIAEPEQFNPHVSGVVPIKVEVASSLALEATGTNAGVVLLELLVDKRVVLAQRSDQESPAPSVEHTFNLDTRLLSNGTHQLYVRAFDPRCTPSIPDYGIPAAGGQSGYYLPLHFTVANGPAATTAAEPAEALAAAYQVSLPLTSGEAGGSLAEGCAGSPVLATAPQSSPDTQPLTSSASVAVATDSARRRELTASASAPYGRYFLCE